MTLDLPVGRQCENPYCPTNSDLAPLADGQKWLNTPGTEGGANGGAYPVRLEPRTGLVGDRAFTAASAYAPSRPTQ